MSPTLYIALDSPKDLTVAEVTETTMMLKWKRPRAKLDLFRLVYTSADGHKADEIVPGSSESLTLRGLTPGMLYMISIIAERGRKTSAPSTISAPTGRHCKNTVTAQTLFPNESSRAGIIEYLRCVIRNSGKQTLSDRGYYNEMTEGRGQRSDKMILYVVLVNS